MMFGVITSRTRVVLGSSPSATALTVMSRSVIIPAKRSSSPQTGNGPTSRSFILCAAARRVVVGDVHSAGAVMISLTCMIIPPTRILDNNNDGAVKLGACLVPVVCRAVKSVQPSRGNTAVLSHRQACCTKRLGYDRLIVVAIFPHPGAIHS